MTRRQIRCFHVGLLLCLSVSPALFAGDAGRSAGVGGEPIAPLPAPAAADLAKIGLGQRLFQDPRLSHGDAVACVSCHRLDEGGDDGLARSVGADGEPLDFNAPTVFNVAFDFRLNWRGNHRTLEEQNEAVLLDPGLMATSWRELLPKLAADAGYASAFTATYDAPPGRDNVLDALAAYQRSLTTPDAPFDRWLRGEAGAITAEEEQGYRLFKAYGCAACHQGVNVGGNLFQKFGIFADPFAGEREPTEGDLGRFAITGVETDRHVFRVPPLRNVAATAPYFHDGRTASLAQAVEIMGRSQLGREIPAADVDRIVGFLGTLTGEHDGRPLAAASGDGGP